MSAAEALATLPGHLHWCPRCDMSWTCQHTFTACPLEGCVAVEDHCDQPAPWDDD